MNQPKISLLTFPFICLCLIGLNVFLASRLTHVGSTIAQNEAAKSEIRNQIATLNLQRISTGSLTYLTQKGESQGYTGSFATLNLNTAPALALNRLP